MRSYHGTSTLHAQRIGAGNVDVTLGGGEIGRGFYTGQHIFEAKAWAYQTTKSMQQNVVEFDTPDADVEAMRLKLLTYSRAYAVRLLLKQRGQTRTYVFDFDMVWAPIVGSARATGDQYKWESAISEALLNGPRTVRRVT